ncbi:hypothetical protein BRADI_4g21290v3 [Brachypodium distachyon]|uniref:Uncharacterized protein n=1 Tax=Brachypodium distachyon TaxID=15368 RepID=I1IMA8_BRADI|nr:hypothetical protein BRADI_4g21290v3 [Brachypodium distachyon]
MASAGSSTFVVDHLFVSHPPNVLADVLLDDRVDVAFVPYSEYWRQARRLVTTPLLAAAKVHSPSLGPSAAAAKFPCPSLPPSWSAVVAAVAVGEDDE